MPDAAGENCRTPPPAGDWRPRGAVVFLIDESAAMSARVAGGTKSRIDSIATAINSLLNQLAGLPPLEFGLVGYRTGDGGQADVGSRWAGPLAGRDLVPGERLAAAPRAVENRIRRIPAAGGIGVDREETVRFPVWYVPELGGAAPRAAAYEHCRRLLAARQCEGGAPPHLPLVISFVGELADPGDLAAAAAALAAPDAALGRPLLFHAHLATSARVPATLLPSGDAHLAGPARELFRATSEVPPALAAALKSIGMPVNDGARGLIYNARMADLIRFLSVAKAYAQQPAAPEPAAAAAATDGVTVTTTTETTSLSAHASALVVLLLDRSVDPSQRESPKNVWARLEQEANRLLAELAASAGVAIDVAVVSYGADASGRVDVRTSLDGAAGGRAVIRAADLAGAALRVEEVLEQVPNGIGGLVEVKRKKPRFIECEPAFAGGLADALAAVGELTTSWQASRAGGPGLPIVLHLSRGGFEPQELERAMPPLREPASQQPLVYHLVLTESPHRSLAYPADAAAIDDPALLRLWELSSPLLGRQTLGVARPAVSGESRGFVVNGRFDLLLEGLRLTLAGSSARGESHQP